MMIPERTWINRLQARWPGVDLRHDTFFDPVSRQILTVDMMVEGVHFRWDYFTPGDVGWRSVAVNLSDVAATGGQPVWALVSLGIPEDFSLADLEALYQGIDACCREHGCQIVGGDTVQAPEVTVSVSLVGYLPKGATPGRRDGAQSGYVLAVSGPHGLSRAGMEALQQQHAGFDAAKQAHLRPQPRLRLGQQLAQLLPQYAMMDSSDGLADAVMRLAEAGGVDIWLEAKRLPCHPDVVALAEKAGCDPMDWMLYGGEDFELAVCLPPEALGAFPELTVVGFVRPALTPGHGQAWLLQQGESTLLRPERMFQHFPASPR